MAVLLVPVSVLVLVQLVVAKVEVAVVIVAVVVDEKVVDVLLRVLVWLVPVPVVSVLLV